MLTVKAAAPERQHAPKMTPLANMVAFPHSYSKLDYDPFKDYVPVAHVAAFQIAFGVGADVPAKTLAEYVALAKKGGTYANFASAAVGSLPHFFGLLFAKTAGLELTHVPYKGTANVLQALMSGEIPAAVLPIADLGALVQSGKGRILATAGARRAPQYPDVPTFKESGYDIEGAAWYALFGAGRHAEGHRRQARQGRDRRGPAARPEAAHRAARTGGDGLRAGGAGEDNEGRRRKWGPVISASGFKAD